MWSAGSDSSFELYRFLFFLLSESRQNGLIRRGDCVPVTVGLRNGGKCVSDIGHIVIEVTEIIQIIVRKNIHVDVTSYYLRLNHAAWAGDML